MLFRGCLQRFLPPRKEIVLNLTIIKIGNKKTTKTRAENDSDLCNQCIFNFRKQSKYEKTHDGKIYGYPSIIQCVGD